jgi:hypothetical protein
LHNEINISDIQYYSNNLPVGKGRLKERCGLEARTNFFRFKKVAKTKCGLDSGADYIREYTVYHHDGGQPKSGSVVTIRTKKNLKHGGPELRLREGGCGSIYCFKTTEQTCMS